MKYTLIVHTERPQLSKLLELLKYGGAMFDSDTRTIEICPFVIKALWFYCPWRHRALLKEAFYHELCHAILYEEGRQTTNHRENERRVHAMKISA